MSYIRSSSNPEGLYIYDNGYNTIILHAVKKPHSSGDNFFVPSKKFIAGLKSWTSSGRYKRSGTKIDGFRVSEVVASNSTGKIVLDRKPCKRGCKKSGGGWIYCMKCAARSYKDAVNSRYVIRIQYKKHFVHLWGVTWEYVCKRFYKYD